MTAQIPPRTSLWMTGKSSAINAVRATPHHRATAHLASSSFSLKGHLFSHYVLLPCTSVHLGYLFAVLLYFTYHNLLLLRYDAHHQFNCRFLFNILCSAVRDFT